MCVHACMRVYVAVYLFVHGCMLSLCMCVHTKPVEHAGVCVCVCVCVCLAVAVCLFVHAGVCMCAGVSVVGAQEREAGHHSFHHVV